MKRFFVFAMWAALFGSPALAQPPAPPPMPLTGTGSAADWIFVFKLNAGLFPTANRDPARRCIFGGALNPATNVGQQYVYATSRDSALRQGAGILGMGLTDPLGATFSQIYNGNYSFVVWNDQFEGSPMGDRGSPWGHAKGMIAWDGSGNGLIMQVTTPSWPGSGSVRSARSPDGNTLGCTARNNLIFSQHFFMLRLNRRDVELALEALANANVPTNLGLPQLASIGGPESIRTRASRLGRNSRSTAVFDATLSTGVRIISKPSALHVPPWQLVSAQLTRTPRIHGPALRTATWWLRSRIPTTTRPENPGCWGINYTPGPVAIATSGAWQGRSIGLVGGNARNGNHAKIGVTTNGPPYLTIFGDLNQEGALSGNATQCAGSQNSRGGLFFVVENRELHAGVTALLAGETAPTILPPPPAPARQHALRGRSRR